MASFEDCKKYFTNNVKLKNKVTFICGVNESDSQIKVLLPGPDKVFQEENFYGLLISYKDDGSITCVKISKLDRERMKEKKDSLAERSTFYFFKPGSEEKIVDIIVEKFNSCIPLEVHEENEKQEILAREEEYARRDREEEKKNLIF